MLDPIIPISHHILSSVDIFWYICLLWDWLLIWQSICPFLCLLIGLPPCIHCIGTTDWHLGTTRCCLSTLAEPFETMSWPMTIHVLTDPQRNSPVARRLQLQSSRAPSVEDDEEGHLIYRSGDILQNRCSWIQFNLFTIYG